MARPARDWDRRIERARVLSETFPFSRQILGFYVTLTDFQKGSILQLQSLLPSRSAPLASLPAEPDEIDLRVLMRRWRLFLSTIEARAPAMLGQAARELKSQGTAIGAALLHAHWPRTRTAHASAGPEGDPLERFCAFAFLQPYAEYLAGAAGTADSGPRPNVCPFCTCPPLVGVLRQEGDGAKRSLVCSFCRTEWDYLRIACPACEERDDKKMCVYSAPRFPCVRIEACDTCRGYITAIDLTKDGRGVPEVDELAAIPLTLWANENGYSKITRNVMGV